MKTSDLVQVTPRAALRIGAFADDAGLSAQVRLAVIGGGTSGFAYDLSLDVADDEDLVVESNGVRVLIAPDALAQIHGSSIDWIEGSNGAGFRIQNPNEPEK